MWPDFSGLIQFARLREAVRLRRLRGEIPPWSADPVLAGYRFSNISPWLDPTTARLLRAVEAAGLAGADPPWQVALLVALRSSSFGPLAERCADRPPLDPGQLAGHVRAVVAQHGLATTPAFSRIGPPLRIVLEPAEAAARIPVGSYTGVEATARLMSGLPWFNPFVAYLAARDLTATPYLANPPDPDWAFVGPGAARGLVRCRASADFLGLRAARDALAGQVPSWPSPDVHDCQHVLCEYYRWARASEGGRPPRMRLSPKGNARPLEPATPNGRPALAGPDGRGGRPNGQVRCHA